MKTLSCEQYLRTFSRRALIWLLGILSFVCGSAASALTPEAISRAVLIVPTRTVDGVASPRNISKLLLGVCKAGGADSFAERMRMAGGEWRLIETPTAAHLVMLLPQTSPEAELLLGNLFDQITAGLRQPLTPPSQPQLNELLLATAIGEYHDNEAKATLWIDGPLAEAQFRLESRLSTILPGDASPLAPPQDFLRYSGASAAVARVLTWEPSTPDAHFTARLSANRSSPCPTFPRAPPRSTSGISRPARFSSSSRRRPSTKSTSGNASSTPSSKTARFPAPTIPAGRASHRPRWSCSPSIAAISPNRP